MGGKLYKWSHKGPRFFSKCSFRGHHGAGRNMEGHAGEDFMGQAWRWCAHFCLLSKGQDPVTGPHVTATDAGFCSGPVCLEEGRRRNEVCEQPQSALLFTKDLCQPSSHMQHGTPLPRGYVSRHACLLLPDQIPGNLQRCTGSPLGPDVVSCHLMTCELIWQVLALPFPQQMTDGEAGAGWSPTWISLHKRKDKDTHSQSLVSSNDELLPGRHWEVPRPLSFPKPLIVPKGHY